MLNNSFNSSTWCGVSLFHDHKSPLNKQLKEFSLRKLVPIVSFPKTVTEALIYFLFPLRKYKYLSSSLAWSCWRIEMKWQTQRKDRRGLDKESDLVGTHTQAWGHKLPSPWLHFRSVRLLHPPLSFLLIIPPLLSFLTLPIAVISLQYLTVV